MSPSFCLLLLTLISVSSCTNPGVKVRVNEKGLDYGRQLILVAIQQKLKTIKVPDISGKQKISVIGKVEYSLSQIKILNVDIPKSAVDLVPGTGVKLSIGNTFITLQGNWRVKYLHIIKDSGSFDLNVNGISISTSIAINSDETGRPTVGSVSCAATVGSATIKFHGGASWLYNLFKDFIDKALRNTIQKQICPLVNDAVSDANPHLKTLNVIAKVDQYTEIEYSMVSSPTVSNSSIDLSLKGEFYNIGKHQEAPFSPTAFYLPPQVNKMMYIGISAYTANTAAFAYNKAGALSLYITDDMIPQSSPIRLNTRTFGTLIPQIAQRFPGLMMKLLLQTEKTPIITFGPNNVTIQASEVVTAYAIQPNATLSPLFALNLEASVTGQVFISETKLAGAITLNKMDLTLRASYVGDFKVRTLESVLQMVLKAVVIPKLNEKLAKGYPLPAIGMMKLRNTQVDVLKDYVLIGTDVQFTG